MFTKKRNSLVKIIPKKLTQRKRLYMSLLVGECLQVAHLMKKKNFIITEEKIVLKKLCKKLKKHAMKIINYEKKK